MATTTQGFLPFAVNVPAGNGEHLQSLSTKVLSAFLPKPFVQEYVDADALTDAQRQQCVDTVRQHFSSHEPLRAFLRSRAAIAKDAMVDKNAAVAKRMKDAGNDALTKGELKLAWELYSTALRFAPDPDAAADTHDAGDRTAAATHRLLRSVAFHNRSLTLMQYAKTVSALSTSSTVGMTEESERALMRVLIAVMLDAAESVVADPTCVFSCGSHSSACCLWCGGEAGCT